MRAVARASPAIGRAGCGCEQCRGGPACGGRARRRGARRAAQARTVLEAPRFKSSRGRLNARSASIDFAMNAEKLAGARVATLAPEYIRRIAPYVPGKPIDELAREYGLAADAIIKLAS